AIGQVRPISARRTIGHEGPLWVDSGGSVRSSLKRLCLLKRTSRSAATGSSISCILIGLTYRIHKPLFSLAEKSVQYLTLIWDVLSQALIHVVGHLSFSP